MNQRIQELLLKAGWDGYEALDERNQKFAELIIQECINVVENNENYSAGITDIVDEYKTGVQVGLASAVCDIERYFDIEN